MTDRAEAVTLEYSASGAPMLRLDDVLLSRDHRGAWLLGLKVPVAGGHRYVHVPVGRHRMLDQLASQLKRSTAGRPGEARGEGR